MFILKLGAGGIQFRRGIKENKSIIVVMACVELELIDCAFPLPVLIFHWIHLYKGIVDLFEVCWSMYFYTIFRMKPGLVIFMNFSFIMFKLSWNINITGVSFSSNVQQLMGNICKHHFEMDSLERFFIQFSPLSELNKKQGHALLMLISINWKLLAESLAVIGWC